jgi:hypothetical protein
MISRRGLLGGTAGVGVLTLAQGVPAYAANQGVGAHAANQGWTGDVSANGWRIDAAAIATHRVEGSATSVALRGGPTAAVLLHVARRWHYEIAPLDTGEGGGVAGHRRDRTSVAADFESNYLSGTAVALHPTAYPLGGSELLRQHQEAVVREILVDCAGTVVWGGDLTPVMVSHFHITAPPGDATLARLAAKFGPGLHSRAGVRR